MASESLIHRAQRGNSDAIAELYEMYVERIHRYVAYRVAGPEDAEDLTAEVFVKMVEGLPGFRLTGVPFEAWLYRIAAARVVDYHRRARRRPQAELSDGLRSDDDPPEVYLVEQQELEQLKRALSQLSGEQQTLLVLRFIERKSHEQVAQILGKTVAAVKSIQHRALTELAAHLGETKVRHYLRGDADE